MGYLSWVLVLLALLVFPSDNSLSWGCTLEERGALLELKSSLEEPAGSPFLASWGNGSDCCQWERVVCDNITKNIVQLSLSQVALYSFNTSTTLPFSEWHLNFSLFNSFKQLRRLFLDENQIIGSLPSKGFLEGLSSLEVLDLSGNNLLGQFPFEVFDRLHNLQELRLRFNLFNGSLPPSLSVPSLRVLDLSKNGFEGRIPPSFFANLTSLKYLDLSSNEFSGHFSLLAFANHSKLAAVMLSKNKGLMVETEFHNWVPPFQLKQLLLSDCNLNQNILSSPGFLSSQHALEAIVLSHNKLIGNFPVWLLENNTKLAYMSLRNNSLSGELRLPVDPKTSILAVDVSTNHMSGEIPSNVGTVFPRLFFLNFSSNALSGNLPPSIGSVTGLRVLDLSRNNLSGEIPYQLTAGCHQLEILDLSDNSLSGTMLPGNSTLQFLSYLSLSNNNFSGTIPTTLFNSPNLYTLDIRNNQLSGNLPELFGNLSGLSTFLAGGNHFEGPLPTQMCNLTWLQVLDLSHNKFSGNIPSCISLSLLNLMYINLHDNNFSGSISSIPFNSFNLVVLDIGKNHLSGRLPQRIGEQNMLRILLLGANDFSGPIPPELCKLSELQMLDLSGNKLSGIIPSCFENTTFGKASLDVYDSIWSGSRAVYFWSLPTSVNKDFIVVSIARNEFPEIEFATRASHKYKKHWLFSTIAMDFSANHLSGSIPGEMGDLSQLQMLDISNNKLTGSIPESLSNLDRIENLDMSHNKLSGSIPSQLGQLQSLVEFSVAHNNLSGRIPDFKASFDASSYEGNKGLCGPPLKKNCTAS